MKRQKQFNQGNKIKYIGSGFIGFDKQNLEATFISYDGLFDAYIDYKGLKVLVRTDEIERLKKATHD